MSAAALIDAVGLLPVIGQLSYAGVGFGALICVALVGLVCVLAIGMSRAVLGVAQKLSLSYWQPGSSEQGPGWYRRLMRCHANVYENIGMYAVIVLAAVYFEDAAISIDLFRLLCCLLVVGRVGQTLVYLIIGVNAVGVLLRFSFFAVQQLSVTFIALCVLRTILFTPVGCTLTDIA